MEKLPAFGASLVLISDPAEALYLVKVLCFWPISPPWLPPYADFLALFTTSPLLLSNLQQSLSNSLSITSYWAVCMNNLCGGLLEEHRDSLHWQNIYDSESGPELPAHSSQYGGGFKAWLIQHLQNRSHFFLMWRDVWLSKNDYSVCSW